MLLDCLSPALPKASRVASGIVEPFKCTPFPVWCCGWELQGLIKCSLCNSRESWRTECRKFASSYEFHKLILHRKTPSQETIISLMGMLAGSLVVSYISSKWATWTAMIILLAIHLGTNYLAVRAVCMQTLNRQRANLVFSGLLEQLGNDETNYNNDRNLSRERPASV